MASAMTMKVARVQVSAMATKKKVSAKPASKGAPTEFYGPNRPLWLGPFSYSGSAVPSYLDGTLAGDYGLDPNRLGADPETLVEYRKQELIHGRWAMVALLGVCVPEVVLGKPWFLVGADVFQEGGLNYLDNPAAIHAPNIIAIVAAQVFFMGLVEAYRVNGGPAGDGLDPLYPGGRFFDPFNLADSDEKLAELKVKEIKHARLAMVGMLGVYFQALTTQEGPVQNWKNHIADPFVSNAFAYADSAYCANDPVTALCSKL